MNAESTLWFNEFEDNKGIELGVFLEANRLAVANVERSFATYAGITGREGETNVDVSVHNKKSLVRNWTVLDTGNSDHRWSNWTVVPQTAPAGCL